LRPPPPAATPSGGSAEPDTRNALFAQLNQGGDITKGLKKVVKGEKIDRPIPVPKAKAAPAPAPAKAAAPAKPPKFGLNGKKWEVEFQKDNQSIVIEESNVKQACYIYKCVNSVIYVKDKINSIALDGCKKCQVVFADVISGVELVDCDSCKLQCSGTVHTIAIDKSQGVQVILNEASLGAEILTAKCSELNVIVPGSEFEGGEYKEFALPEQFISKWNAATKKYETECMSHSA
jgi:adenylyl cyclase-associated protein